MTKKMYDNVFVARGIGILLVVIGHIVLPESYVGATIYSFHMPLFIILSGVFAGTCEKYGFFDYLKKNIVRLIVPYVVFTLIGIGLNCIIPEWRADLTADRFKDVLLNCNGWYWHATGVLWFLVALFEVKIIFYFYHKYILAKNNVMLSTVSILFMFFAAFYSVSLEQKLGFTFPFQLKSAFIALPFYTMGYLFRDNIKSFEVKKGSIPNWITLVCAVILTFFFAVKFNYIVNLGANSYNDHFFYILFAISGSYIVIMLGAILKGSRVLKFCGKYSMDIYLLHTIIQHLFNWFIQKFLGKEIETDFGAQNVIRFLVVMAFSVIGAIIIERVKLAIKEKKSQPQLEKGL